MVNTPQVEINSTRRGRPDQLPLQFIQPQWQRRSVQTKFDNIELGTSEQHYSGAVRAPRRVASGYITKPLVLTEGVCSDLGDELRVAHGPLRAGEHVTDHRFGRVLDHLLPSPRPLQAVPHMVSDAGHHGQGVGLDIPQVVRPNRDGRPRAQDRFPLVEGGNIATVHQDRDDRNVVLQRNE